MTNHASSYKSTREKIAKSADSGFGGDAFFNLIGILVIVVCVFGVGFFVGKLWGGSVTTTESRAYSIIGDRQNESITEVAELDFDHFWEVWQTMTTQYVDEDISQEDMYNGAIKGMVAGVGDYATIYLTEEETQEYQKGNQGKFEGIGAELGYEESLIVVVAPLENSPAQKAGLRPGDIILAVDGEEIHGENIFGVVGKIRGEKGTVVTLTVAREGQTEELNIDVTRDEITVPSVTLDSFENGVAVIDVDRFTEASSSAWNKRWDEIVAEVVEGEPKAVVLDLRGNPGGYFNAAVWAAGEFLPSGSLVAQQHDRAGGTVDFNVERNGSLKDIPLVVLVDEGSASASEILSGALQYHGRAYIIGEKTYGKGTAQQIVDYTNGASLHITTLKWVMPDGRQLDKDNVIEPDEIVELTDEDFKNGDDPQLDRAIEYVMGLI